MLFRSGLMIFDIVHINNRNWWDALAQAVAEQEAEMIAAANQK